LDQPVTGAGYYYSRYTARQFNLSSRLLVATPAQLKAAGVQATAKPSLLIERFEKDWQKEWFTYDLTDNWARKTHKLHDPQWQAPAGAKLALEVRCEQPRQLVVGLDDYAAEVRVTGGNDWQRIVLQPADFRNVAGASLADWNRIKELRLGPQETLRGKIDGKEKSVTLGAVWQGPKPEFRNLRWVKSTE